MTVALPIDKRFKDLTGQQFGWWTVLAYAGRRKGNHRWHCRCICSTEKVVPGNNLKNGRTTSCGCSKREALVGRRFGRLLVIELVEARRYQGTTALRWACRCDCGNITTVFANSLKTGTTVSCGCYGKEQRKKANTTHGRTGTAAYKREHKNRRRGLEITLDSAWTLEMEQALREFQLVCAICGTADNLTVDHVRALSKGHGLCPGNATLLCGPCNSKKHNKALEELHPEVRDALVKAAAEFQNHWEA